jgi:hypothetical protein
MTLHAAAGETGFFVVSAIVLLVCLWTLREAHMDLAALTARQVNGPRRATADGNIQECWFNLAVALVMLLASTLALMFEPPPPDYSQLPQSQVFLVAWIVVGILIVTSGLLSKSRRRRLMRMSPVEHTEVTSITESPDQQAKHTDDPPDEMV